MAFYSLQKRRLLYQTKLKKMKTKVLIGLGIIVIIILFFINSREAKADYPKPNCNDWCIPSQPNSCRLHTPDYDLIFRFMLWP